MARVSRFRYLFPLLLVTAGILRLILIPNPGFEADVSFWKSWGLATLDRGIVEGMKITNNNYPTPFAYTLGAMVWVYSLFSDPHTFKEFWLDTNMLFLTISKALPILADFGIAFLIYHVGKHAKKLHFPEISLSVFGLSFYELLSVVYLLNPIALIDGAWWGQVDSLGLVIFLASLLLVLKKKPFLAGIIYMLSMMTKLQNMIYGPLFFLFVWQMEGYAGLIQSICGALLSFAGLNIEFLLTKNTDRVIASLTENYDYFPWMSLIAFNLWWIVSGAQGLITSDKYLMLGLINAKTLGLFLFSSFYLFAALRQFFEAKNSADTPEGKPTILRFALEGLVLINAAFFLFQTQSHDRYAFPISVFLLFWAPFYVKDSQPWNERRKFTFFAFFYGLFTLFYFYNLHTALAINYPQNGLPLLSLLTQPTITITVAYILLGLFGVFVFTLLRHSQRSRSLFGITIAILILGLLAQNKNLFTKQPVLLTKLTPFVSEQAYGTRQTDRSVQSSYGDPYKWQRLSVQYLFYKHGIGSHANARYVYDVGGNFSRFTTDMGVDTESGEKASVIFEIYGDNTILFRSPKMGRFDLPKHADVKLNHVKRLTLVITDAGDGNYDDHADWLNPMLWP